MIELIKQHLSAMEGLAGWRIVETSKNSTELYFIKKTLDMPRHVNTKQFSVTLYVNLTKEGEAYLGESVAMIYPTMDTAEVEAVLKDCYLAASYVFNKPYSLPDKELSQGAIALPQFEFDVKGLVEGIFENDVEEEGGLSASELFLNLKNIRIITSEGIDVGYSKQSAMTELVTYWKDQQDGVELFDNLYFGQVKKEQLSARVKEMLDETKARSVAEPMKDMEGVPVVLCGANVADFFKFFVTKANAQMVFEGISNYSIGHEIQGADSTGDLLSITCLPFLENSSQSAPVDMDGVALKPLTIIEDGKVKNIHGAHRYTQYLGLETTGRLPNLSVGLGTVDLSEIKKSPHILMKTFSDFMTSPMTGDFGGELRLAIYFDGEKYTPVTGGTITANIMDVMKTIRFSNEKLAVDTYEGPSAIIFDSLKVYGA